jgi:hypothetical protein
MGKVRILPSQDSHFCLVKEVLAYNENNQSSKIILVNEEWIIDSTASKNLVDISAYTHGNQGQKRSRSPSVDKVIPS